MALRKFRIKVNDVVYEVEAEEVFSAEASVPAVAPQVETLSSTARVEPVRPKAPAVQQNGLTVIESPLPGSVLDVKVAEGDLVEVGQVLIILEAMKMENEVASPVSGKIRAVKVKKGSAVDANDVLVTIDNDLDGH